MADTRADDDLLDLLTGGSSGFGVSGETETTTDGDLDSVFGVVGGGDDSDVYEQRAQSYLRNYASQFGPAGIRWPQALTQTRGIAASVLGGFGDDQGRSERLAGIDPSDPAISFAIRELGAKLYAAGYLSESGSFDPGQVIRALAEVEADKDATEWGGTTDSYLSSLIRTNSTLGKQDKQKFTPRPFEKPPLEKMAQEDLEQAIEASFTSVLGRRPKDEELHRFASEFRSRQAKAHEQEVGVAREIHEAREGFRRTKFEGGGGGERTIELGPIEEEPNPRNLTTERLVDTDEAKAFHGARLGLDLLSALRGGF